MKGALALTVAGLLLAAAGANAAAPAAGAGSRTYRWVDEKGVVHYGDNVPPEYTRGQTSELNRQGLEVRRFPAQPTPEEARSAEEQAAAAAREKQHDQFLISTYLSVRDIEQLRDERLALLDGQVTAAEGFLAAAEGRMQGLMKRAMNFRPYSSSPTARRLPDALAEELVQTLGEERAQRQTLEQKKAEKEEMRSRFQRDIDRYQFLASQRGLRSPR